MPTAPKSAAILAEKITLRILGTSVTMYNEIREQAERDLGINLEYIIDDGMQVQRHGTMYPQSYDLYDQWFHSIDCLWPAKALQAIDTNKIKRWSMIDCAIQQGILGNCDKHRGSIPLQRLFVQHDGSLSQQPSTQISMLPFTYNTDSFLYLKNKVPSGLLKKGESWSWLLAPEFKGNVAIQADAAIGAIDAALAVQASGLASFKDIGNLSIREIDTLIAILKDFKLNNHFYGVWSTVSEAIQFMTTDQVSIQSIWSPSIKELNKQRLNYQVARPKEGYRGWFGGIGLSRFVSKAKLDACYDYLNWSLDGWVADVLEQKGIQTINSFSRQQTKPSQAAPHHNFASQHGKTMLKPQLQENKDQTIHQVAVWNSVMDEHNYLVRRWHEFLRCPPVNFLHP